MRVRFIRFLLLLALIGGLWVQPAEAAAPAFVTGQVCTSSTDPGSDTSTCTLPGGTTAGNLVVCGISGGGANTTAGTVGTSNMAGAVAATHASGQLTEIWYAVNVNAGQTVVTLTHTGSTGYQRLACAEYTGIVTSTPVGVTASSVVDTGTSITSGSATTTAGNELVVGIAMSEGQLSTWAAAGAFTERAETVTEYTLSIIDRVQSTVASVSADWTLSTTEAATALMATFKATDTGVGGGTTCSGLLLGVSRCSE